MPPTPQLVRIRQDKQIRSSESYTDLRPNGPVMESAQTLQEDLDNLRSQVARILNTSLHVRWYETPTAGIAQIVNEINWIEGQMGITGHARQYNQGLIGPKNGTNKVFTCATKFVHDAIADEALYWNGVRLRHGTGYDYVASESVPAGGYDTVTLLVAPIAQDDLTIDITPKSL